MIVSSRDGKVNGGWCDVSVDRQSNTDDRRSLYFTDQGWTGGKVFDYAQDGVRQFLIDNALFFLNEYRIDGIRYDEVTVMHYHGGDVFCRDLTSKVRYAKPQAIQIAEYWAWDRAFPATCRFGKWATKRGGSPGALEGDVVRSGDAIQQ